MLLPQAPVPYLYGILTPDLPDIVAQASAGDRSDIVVFYCDVPSVVVGLGDDLSPAPAPDGGGSLPPTACECRVLQPSLCAARGLVCAPRGRAAWCFPRSAPVGR
jgi:hypothetical protein